MIITTQFIIKAATQWFRVFWPIKPVKTSYIDFDGQIAHWLTMMQGRISWCSIDIHFATGVSAIYNHSLWHGISVMVFWQLFYPLHVHSPLSLHCSLIMPIYPLKYTLKCPLIEDNDNSQRSRSLQLILFFTVSLAQKATFVFKLGISCITTQQIAY